VPLSYAWTGEELVLAVEESALTARNIRGSGRARLALGGSRDVVMVDARLETVVPVHEAADSIGERYATQADWDPRQSHGDLTYLLLRPQRIQVWREANEIADRTVMRDGLWTT
jgi:hypothetical protein